MPQVANCQKDARLVNKGHVMFELLRNTNNPTSSTQQTHGEHTTVEASVITDKVLNLKWHVVSQRVQFRYLETNADECVVGISMSRCRGMVLERDTLSVIAPQISQAKIL